MEDSDASGSTPRRKNMRRDDRDQQILEEAVRFFAECGFEGQTRELAKRLGVSHAVIYRHFDSKEALIERVYEHVYTSRWRSQWEDWVTDRSQPLEARLIRFYCDYADCVFEYEWVRIFISSGLKSYGLPERYLAIVRDRIIGKPILPNLAGVRRQNIRHRSGRRLAECGPRLGLDVRRPACGAASADIRWSVV